MAGRRGPSCWWAMPAAVSGSGCARHRKRAIPIPSTPTAGGCWAGWPRKSVPVPSFPATGRPGGRSSTGRCAPRGCVPRRWGSWPIPSSGCGTPIAAPSCSPYGCHSTQRSPLRIPASTATHAPALRPARPGRSALPATMSSAAESISWPTPRALHAPRLSRPARLSDRAPLHLRAGPGRPSHAGVRHSAGGQGFPRNCT